MVVPLLGYHSPAVRIRFLFSSLPLLIGAACGGAPAGAPAHTGVTFSKDVAPIVFANCAPCHRPGEVAPFSLLTYAGAAKHADGMAEETRKHHMPPWLPERGDFPIVGERRLTPD